MADKKISALTAQTNAGLATDDVIPIVDTSATETKKIAISELDTRYIQNSKFTAPTTYTPTFAAGSCTFTDVEGIWWQEGFNMVGRVSCSVDTGASAGEFTFTIPAGYTIHTAYLLKFGVTDAQDDSLGYGKWFDNGSAYRGAMPQYASATTMKCFYPEGSSIINGSFLANGDRFSINFKVPITSFINGVDA